MSEGNGTRLIGGTPFLRVGAGQPLVFQPGLTTHHHPPQGMDLRFQRGQCGGWHETGRCGGSTGAPATPEQCHSTQVEHHETSATQTRAPSAA